MMTSDSFKTIRAATLAATIALSVAACGGGDTATKGDAAGSSTAAPAAGAGGAAAPAAAGAAASTLDPILANPQVGDLYSGELTHFSRANFGEDATAAYGMMRVVAVSDTQVTVITETGAYPAQGPATAELNSGDMSTITWDETERLPINRADLATLVRDGKIAAFRRP